MEQLLHSLSPDAEHANCWRSIGIRGDKSCEALARYAHCRNCPRYSEIAVSLLERDATGDSSEGWDERYAARQQHTNVNDQSVLVVRLGTEWFAIDTAALDEVLEVRAVHSLPHRANPAVLGVTNVRGELVVCVSLQRLLGIPAAPADSGNRLLVLRSGGGRMAVPVDEVQRNVAYRAEDLVASPETSARSPHSYTVGLLTYQSRMVSCLDVAKVIGALEGVLA